MQMQSGALVIALVVLAACQSPPAPGASCTRQSECTSPLVCAFGRCRAECAQNRDCPVPAHCLLVDGITGACSLEIDTQCETGVGRACASGLVCAANRCEGGCQSDADCPADGDCLRLATGAGFCFDARDGDAGIAPPDAGSDAGTDAFRPDAGPPPIGVLDVCVGTDRTCAIGHDRNVYCWGLAACAAGQVPTRILGITGADTIACGDRFACAHLSADDHVVCWGDNEHGQLGVPPTAGCTASPTTVLDVGGSPLAPTAPAQLSLAGTHACALYAGGASLMCWGESRGIIDPTMPALVSQARFAQINYDVPMPQLLSADVAPDGICVRNEDYVTIHEPRIYCSGEDGHHELAGSTMPSAPLPTYWSIALAVGRTHRCSLGSDHQVQCWGGGQLGQLGVAPSTLGTCGTDACSMVAQQIAGVQLAGIATSGDGDTTCGIVTSESLPGEVLCWGANDWGQTGHAPGPFAVVSSPPAVVTLDGNLPLSRVQRIAVGRTRACAIDDQERLYCWGEPSYYVPPAPPGSPFATEILIAGGQ